MAFVDRLKERLKKRVYEVDTDDEFNYLRGNPKYTQVINKLDELVFKRAELYRQLARLEIDIDSCLVLISVGIEKDNIGGENG